MNPLVKAKLLLDVARWRVSWHFRNTDYSFTVPGNEKFMGPREAIRRFVRDGDVVGFSGLGGNQHVTILYCAIRDCFLESGHPRDLTVLCIGGMGGRGRVKGTLEELGHPSVEELILQTLLFAGFPRTIEALKVLRRLEPTPSRSKGVAEPDSQGAATSARIYGDRYPRLLDCMDQLHPDLTRWMIRDGYGRVLSRPGPHLLQRQCAVVGALMVMGMLEQFRAHLRGLLNTGLDRDGILWLTNTFQIIIPAAYQTPFREAAQRVMNTTP